MHIIYIFRGKNNVEMVSRSEIDEAMIEALVASFYARVRLMSGRYHGKPMQVHLPLAIDRRHFNRWLEIFAATARDLCPPSAAALFLDRASRIADSLELGIAAQKGEITPRRPRP